MSFLIVYVMSVDSLFLSIPITFVKAVDCGVQLCGVWGSCALSRSNAFKNLSVFGRKQSGFHQFPPLAEREIEVASGLPRSVLM